MLQSLKASLERREGELAEILGRHSDVAGVSLGLIVDNDVVGVSQGYARVSTDEVMTPAHYLECASLSKTVATAFALEYFRQRGVCFHTTRVNTLLERAGSPWRITPPPSGLGSGGGGGAAASSPDWANNVVLSMLVNHTALGMHYVYGIPLADLPMPSSLDFLNGTHEAKYGYKPLFIERQPGAEFRYSGGGFIVLQHLIEALEGGKKSIEEITRSWLDRCGLRDFTFSNETPYCAFGHLTRRKEVAGGGRLAFPAFAAGGLCTPSALATFLSLLAQAYHGADTPGAAISRATAVDMMGPDALLDKGALAFMRGRVGLGVFVAVAGENRFLLHQAANEGFRGVYLVCFDGPDRGNGFVLLCNGDNPAVLFQCEVCRLLLGPKCFNFAGVNFDGLVDIQKFDYSGLKQEVIVNLGLKELVLAGFQSEDNDRAPSTLSKL